MTGSGRRMPWMTLAAGLALGGCTRDQPPPPSPAPAPAPAPAPSPATQGTAPAPTPAEPDWTSSPIDQTRSAPSPVTLREVRAAHHEGFDRVVFQFDGEQVPGYHVSVLDTPAVRCGSGDTVTLAGEGRLQVRLQPAQAHAEGHSTLPERKLHPALPLLEELEQTCDFEGEVTWVLGLKQTRPFRVMELHGPTRLVVDVRD